MNAEPLPPALPDPPVALQPAPEKEKVAEPPVTLGERWLGAVPILLFCASAAGYLAYGAHLEGSEYENPAFGLLISQYLGVVGLRFLQLLALQPLVLAPLMFGWLWLYFALIAPKRSRIGPAAAFFWLCSGLMFFFPLLYFWPAFNGYSRSGKLNEKLPSVTERLSGALALALFASFMPICWNILNGVYYMELADNAEASPLASFFRGLQLYYKHINAVLVIMFALFLCRTAQRIRWTLAVMTVTFLGIVGGMAALYAGLVGQ